MAFPPHPLPAGNSHSTAHWMFCSYRNTTNRMVIVRARAEGPFFLERVVFPFELMTFHCPSDGEVEVVTRSSGGDEQSDRLAAAELRSGECAAEPDGDWRPHRTVRGVSVRSNASHVSIQGQ